MKRRGPPKGCYREGMYVKYVLCNSCIEPHWDKREEGKTRCPISNQRYRTGPKDLQLKKKYDDLITRY